jgi:hypothetical protein
MKQPQRSRRYIHGRHPQEPATKSVYGPALHKIFVVAASIGYTLAAVDGELTCLYFGPEISKGTHGSTVAVGINDNQHRRE